MILARDSRPPGFDMTYRPEEPRRFGKSARACLVSYAYLGAAVLFAAFVFYGYVAPPGSLASRYVLEAQRSIPATWFAAVVLSSGVAAVLRAHMCGVMVTPDGIETLELAAFGMPRVRRIHWPMINRFRFDLGARYVGIDLWNGTRELLPAVADREALVRSLAYIAEARAIPYSGGPPADLDFGGPYRAPGLGPVLAP
jgi:hypothetical protein